MLLMDRIDRPPAPWKKKIPWLKTFKYLLYGLLLVNLSSFFQENWLAAQYAYPDGLSGSELITAFADSIDTFVWIMLLMLFEMETSVIPDKKLVGTLKHTLHGTRLLCFLVLVYAFYGYLDKVYIFYQYTPITITNLCQLTDMDSSYLVDLDKYLKLTATNCASLSGGAGYLELSSANIVASTEIYHSARLLAWTDSINAGAWLMLVLVLEVDVRLQLKNQLQAAPMLISKCIKTVLYITLGAAAVYWGIAGDFVDFWDALLWILAFVLIELNIFKWQEETAQVSAP